MLQRYLPDLRRGLERDAWAAILSNHMKPDLLHELRGRILSMVEYEELSLARIQVFYGVGHDGKPL